jgi:hypothetical protein
MWRSKTVWMLAFALAIGVLGAGCGGDDGDDGDDTDPKQEYIAKGDEVCAFGTFQIGSEARNRYGSPQPPPEKIQEYGRKIVVPILHKQVIPDLRELAPPEGDEQRVAAIYDALQAGVDTLRDDPTLIAEPNVGGAFDEANSLAQAYGFKQCGSN